MEPYFQELKRSADILKEAANEIKSAALEIKKAALELTQNFTSLQSEPVKVTIDGSVINDATLEVNKASVELKQVAIDLNAAAIEMKKTTIELTNIAEVKKSSPPEVTPKIPQSLILEYNLREALKVDKGPLAQLVSWRVQDFTTKGDNYSCVVSSGVVKYTLDGKEDEVTYVAKLNPCRGIPSMENFTARIFEKEILFYEKLVSEFDKQLHKVGQHPLRLPKCYYTCDEPENQIILLEDMRAKGFKMFDRRKGMDVAHTNLVLRELARLHAASVLLQQETSEDLAVKYPVLGWDWTQPEMGLSKEQMKEMFAANMTTGAIMASKIDGYENVVAWLNEKSSSCLDSFSEQLQKSPPFDVVNHGDCWNNNLLFRYDDDIPVEVMLLDLQVTRKGSPALDLNYLLYTSLTGESRKPNLKAFLSTYHQTFSEILHARGQPMTFTEEELMVEFKNKNMFGLLMAIIVVPIIVWEVNEVIDFAGMVDGNMEEFIKKNREKMLDQMDTNPLLRPRFLSIFDEMIDSGLIT